MHGVNEPPHDWERGAAGGGGVRRKRQKEAGTAAKRRGGEKKKLGKGGGPPGRSGRAGMRTHREPSCGESARQEKQTHAQTTGTHNGKLLIWPEHRKAPIPRTPSSVFIRPWPQTREKSQRQHRGPGEGKGGGTSCGGRKKKEIKGQRPPTAVSVPPHPALVLLRLPNPRPDAAGKKTFCGWSHETRVLSCLHNHFGHISKIRCYF